MTKVLYISNYRDQSGYSQAARDYISSLKLAGVSVAARSIKLTPTTHELNQTLLEAESESTSDCDVVIQHTLPPLFEFSGKFRKNIGLFHLETDRIPQNWVRQCNLMDSIWVSCHHNKKTCEDSGVTVPIEVVPIPLDTAKFQQSYKKAHFRKVYESDFIFYTVGEFNKRKNLEAIVRAFHGAFKPNEPVQLLIKTSIPGLSPDQARKQVGEFCQSIKNLMGLYPSIEDYKKELLITDSISEADMCSLHTSCDCFVNASYGEAWCLPAVDALGFGRHAILPNHTVFQDYPCYSNILYVQTQEEPCFGYQNSVPGVYTSAANWYSPNITHLAGCMRGMYQSRFTEFSVNSGHFPYNVSYEKVGEIMKGLLK